jgi:hypothetical protein
MAEPRRLRNLSYLLAKNLNQMTTKTAKTKSPGPAHPNWGHNALLFLTNFFSYFIWWWQPLALPASRGCSRAGFWPS